MKKFIHNPFLIFVFTFFVIILIGSILLYLPGINESKGYGYIDALFTSTSAVCVTGLATFPVSSFSFLGQVIILILIQLGAIGIMSLGTFLILFLRGELDFEGRITISKIGSTFSIHEADKVIVFIFFYLISIEFIGSVLLFFGFFIEGFDLKHSLYYSVFHSISAFCNAGFSTFDNSLIGKSNFIKIVISLLIILGGVGFYVVFDLLRYLKHKREKIKIKIHTKIVLITTIFLIAFGSIIILIVEPDISFTDALFQSVTARTAGFNTVDIASLHNISIFVILNLMVIGGSPGSTAGGIKTTTFFVISLSVLRVLKGEKRANAFKREISTENVLKAHTVFFLYMLLISIGTTLLLYNNDAGFIGSFFEVTSAVGTVGLSLGITSALSEFGKFIIICLMFAGRVGPSVLFMVLLKKEKKSKIAYPEEKIILG